MVTFDRQATRLTAAVMAAALGMATMGAAALAAGPRVGTVAALTGSVIVNPSGGGAATPLTQGAEINEGDTVQTVGESRVKLVLIDGSTLSLGAGSTIKLDHLQMKPETGALSTTLALLGGYLRAVVAKVKGGAQFQIVSPSMVAAVRGTDWIEQLNAGVTQIFVAQGFVSASGTAAYAGDRVLLTAGQGVSFSAAAPHTPVVRWKKPKIDLFVAATAIR
jgi:hypothetical protein